MECWARNEHWELLTLWSWTPSWTHCKNLVKTVSPGPNRPVSEVSNSLLTNHIPGQGGQHFAFHPYYCHRCIIYTHRGGGCLDRRLAGSGKHSISHNRQGLSQLPAPCILSPLHCHPHRKECSRDTRWPRLSRYSIQPRHSGQRFWWSGPSLKDYFCPQFMSLKYY